MNNLMQKLQRLRDEIATKHATKVMAGADDAANMYHRQKIEFDFTAGADAFIPMIVELATALDVIRENGEIAPPNADTMVARLALAKLEKFLGDKNE